MPTSGIAAVLQEASLVGAFRDGHRMLHRSTGLGKALLNERQSAKGDVLCLAPPPGAGRHGPRPGAAAAQDALSFSPALAVTALHGIDGRSLDVKPEGGTRALQRLQVVRMRVRARRLVEIRGSRGR